MVEGIEPFLDTVGLVGHGEGVSRAPGGSRCSPCSPSFFLFQNDGLGKFPWLFEFKRFLKVKKNMYEK
jgi:hypothetical protein